jgi:plasmid stabilization system protein ParE
MFAEDLDGAFETLSIFPKAGGLYHARLGIRRLLLRATRHHVYYVIDQFGVLVIAVWGAVKGRPPDLRTLL